MPPYISQSHIKINEGGSKMFKPVNELLSAKEMATRCGDICTWCDEPDDSCARCDTILDVCIWSDR